MTTSFVRLVPERKLQVLGDYDVDRVVLERDEAGDVTDFRFELGQGYMIYWAVPVAPNGRLRLILVDSAVMHIDEPEVHRDSCSIDLELWWRGELDRVRDRVVEEVKLTCWGTSYRVDVVIREPDRRATFTTLQYG